MKGRRLLFVFSMLALWQPAPVLRAQTNLANALDTTNLVWTTSGTGGAEWYYNTEQGGDNTFDGIASARSGKIYDNGETWMQTTVVGPGTVSFWWQAYSEPNADWLEFYVGSDRQARICGGGDDWSSWPSGWQYCSFPVPAGTNVLKWRYAKDASKTGGTLDTVWVDQVSYLTSPPPPLQQALNTSGVEWSSSGSVYDNGWFAQTNVTHDGQWAAQSGAIWHNQTNWLQTTVSGVTNVSFWWAVSSQASGDFLEFYTNGVLAKQISGVTAWQTNFFKLPSGTNTLTWLYRKDPSVTAGSNCGWLDQVVFSPPIKVPTNNSLVALSSSINPAVFGQAVIFTANASAAEPGAGTPTGTVTFKDGATALATRTLSSGQVSYTNATLAVAAHLITAVYNGDVNFISSTSSSLTQTVVKAATTTTLTSTQNPSVSGQAVTFTAMVAAVSPGAGTPSGTVQFKTNGVNFGSAVSLSGGIASSPALSSLAVGTVTVNAAYSGDSSFNSSDDSASPLTQTINKAATTTTLASSKNPSSIGDPVSWTATVSVSAPGAGTPTGTVQFKIDGTNIDGLITLSGGSATSLAISTLAAGTHTISAAYSGDGSSNTNTSANFTQTVNTSPLTPATGGTAISADTTGGTYTSLNGPVYIEPSLGAVGVGTIILNAPAGFVFDTGGTGPTVKITGGTSSAKNINDAVSGTALAMTSITATQLTFTVTAASASGGTPNTLTWQNIRVRPTAGTPLASGTITKTGTSTMSGVATGANLGFLAEAAGAANRLVVQNPPSATATAGIAFAQQPKIQIQDQFGNARTFANRNADHSTAVSVARNAGTATLQGTLTATAANGLATFSNLSYHKAETITLQFTSGSLTSATSGNIAVSPAAASQLLFTTQPGSATYGSALNPQPMLKSLDAFGNDSSVGLPANELVTLSVSAGTGSLQGTTSLDIGTSAGNGTVAFSGLQVSAAGAGKQLTATAAGLASALSTSFIITRASATVGVASDKWTVSPTDSVTLAVALVADAPSTATPSGSVRFVANGTNNLGSPVTLVKGQATLTVLGSALAQGANTITAFFSDPTGNFNSSSGDLNPALVATGEASNMPPVIQSIAPQPDGSMELTASGFAGQTYLIQACEILGAWATIGTNVTDANGIIVFLDQEATNYTSRFYRLAAP